MSHEKGTEAHLDEVPDGTENNGPSAAEVAGFLRKNPDFLSRDPDLLHTLLKAMTPPDRWSDDGVVDIQRFMLEQLRGEIDSLRDCAESVIETSRGNLESQIRMHDAALALWRADGLVALLETFAAELPAILDVDAVAIAFESGSPPPPGLAPPLARVLPEGGVDAYIGLGQEALLLDDAGDDGSLFGETRGDIRSLALLRLHEGQAAPAGLIAFGAHRPGVFHPGQGTDLVVFLARVVEHAVDRWLSAPS